MYCNTPKTDTFMSAKKTPFNKLLDDLKIEHAQNLRWDHAQKAFHIFS